MNMEILVCVKHVPETSEVDITIDSSKKAIETSNLVFDLNEYDDYALEEAVQIKERIGGTVTVITVGPSEADSTLRKCLARGADKAIRVTDEQILGSDGYAIAKILHALIKDISYDLILTGTVAIDDGYSVVGPVLGELLGIPHVIMVKKLELVNDSAKTMRELEGGIGEQVEVNLPAVFAIQTGINEPRYVSIMAIRKAMSKEIQVIGLSDLGLTAQDVGESGSWLTVQEMFIPQIDKQAEFLEGSLDTITTKITDLIKSKGLI